MEKTMTASLTFLPFAALLLWAIWKALMIPVVYVSYSTEECVRVETAQGRGSCENLPKRYTHVWVK